MAASGSVYRRVRKRPGKKDAVTWEARWRDDQGVQRRKTFARRSDAEQFLTKTLHELHSGTYISPEAGKITLREFAEEWRAAQVHHRPSTRAQHETHLRRHVYPHLGARTLADLRPSEVQAWVKRLSETLAPSTVKVIYRVLAGIYSSAVRDRRVTSNPCTGTKLPEVQSKRVKPMTTAGVAALIDAVPDRYRALLILAAGTGMRQGECFGLTLDRVDFLRRTVAVDRQLILLPGAGPEFGPPKTKASIRTIPLPQSVVDALAAHLAAYPAGAEGFVFTNNSGLRIHRNRFSDSVWHRAVRAVGAEVEGETFHGLRHHYASLLIRYGESVKTVQARLGHASATETLDTYGHLWPDSDDRTREAVDAAWSGALVATSWPRLTAAD